MKLPYQEFEDQRSGETLSILTKVRIDTEKFVSAFINILFPVIIGIVFVAVYATAISLESADHLFWRDLFIDCYLQPAQQKSKDHTKKYCWPNQFAGRSYYGILTEY